jgi:two-component system, sensor histidine kinase RegB
MDRRAGVPDTDGQTMHRINLSWLIKLRWGAAAGQVATILVVQYWMHIRLPLLPLLALVAAAAASNVAASLWSRRAREVREGVLVALLAFDVAVLTGLLFFTGGPFNPFSFLYLVHIALAAVVVRSVWTWVLVVLSLVASGALFFGHVWLALDHSAPSSHLEHMHMHLVGMWIAFAVAAAFIVYFVTRIGRALARRETDLQAERNLVARSEKLAALATLAAGAAHELATPLATIVVAARELERQLAGGRPVLAADLMAIREGAARCRAILDRMAADAGEGAGEAPTAITIDELMARALPGLPAEPSVTVAVDESARHRPLVVPPTAMVQALRSVLKNAQEASPSGAPVAVSARAASDGPGAGLEIEVRDQGPGMPPDILRRAGEPFFTTKPPGKGMGLGLFLTRSVLERLGGAVNMDAATGGGTCVRLLVPWDVRAAGRVRHLVASTGAED